MINKKQFLNRIYLRYSDELTKHLCSQFHFSSSDSEDVVQTAFAKFAELPDMQVVTNPGAFLYRTAHNIVLDRKRHQNVKINNKEELQRRSLLQDECGPDRVVASRKRLEILSEVLASMPSKRRRFLLMSRFEGLSNVEIAKQVGLSESAVRKHIARALLDCKQALDNEV